LADKFVSALRAPQADHGGDGFQHAEWIQEREIGAVLKFRRKKRPDILQVFIAGSGFIGIPALDFFDQELNVEFEVEGTQIVIENAVCRGDGQPLQAFGQGFAGGLEDALDCFGGGDSRRACVDGIVSDAHAGGQPADVGALFEDFDGMPGSGQTTACG